MIDNKEKTTYASMSKEDRDTGSLVAKMFNISVPTAWSKIIRHGVASIEAKHNVVVNQIGGTEQ